MSIMTKEYFYQIFLGLPGLMGLLGFTGLLRFAEQGLIVLQAVSAGSGRLMACFEGSGSLITARC